jgi:hypothetical protein
MCNKTELVHKVSFISRNIGNEKGALSDNPRSCRESFFELKQPLKKKLVKLSE